jgi:hypothetical protein
MLLCVYVSYLYTVYFSHVVFCVTTQVLLGSQHANLERAGIDALRPRHKSPTPNLRDSARAAPRTRKHRRASFAAGYPNPDGHSGKTANRTRAAQRVGLNN